MRNTSNSWGKNMVSAEQLKEDLPIWEKTSEQIKKHRETIKNILDGKDQRMIVIAGPCSMDYEKPLLEFWKKLKALQDQCSDKIILVMRTYESKPRTTTGCKWMIQWWELWNETNLYNWLYTSRSTMKKIAELNIPIANEILYPHLMPYFDDLVSYQAIWARSSENQQHKEAAASSNTPVGIKNQTHWQVETTANSLIAARSKQPVFIPGFEEITEGNPYSHIILRWYLDWNQSISNINDTYIESILRILNKKQLGTKFLVDLNHDNSWKNPDLQKNNMEKALTLNNLSLIVGFMIEAYLKKGNTKNYSKQENTEWVSSTDPCSSFEELKDMIQTLYNNL